MVPLTKLVSLLVLSLHLSFCHCNLDEFQANVDGFMNAFDEVFTTEDTAQTTNEIPIGTDIAPDSLAVGEETSKDFEEPGSVQEEVAVTESVFKPGSDVRHEINEDLIKFAAKVVASISPDLELVNVTQALSSVTDKVERSFLLRVAQRNCEGDCSVSCIVDVISDSYQDTVTWHNCLENNEIPRIKRGAVGGFKQVDEAEAKELAEIAVQTLDSIDADDVKRVVTQVIRAQKQLVNGIMYHLTLEMAQSDCTEDKDKCEGKLSDYNICKILMQRLFSGEAPHNAQVIKSECNPITKAKEIENIKQEQKRAKRYVAGDGVESNMVVNHNQVGNKKSLSHGRLMGGKVRQDPNSDKIKEISQFALEEIDKASNSLNEQKIVRVVDARTQVVSGAKYFLKMELVETNCRKGSDQETCSPLRDQVIQSCEVVVWDKPWEKFRTVTQVNCSPVNSRQKRGIPGGLSPADVNDDRVKEMAQFAVAQLSAKSNSLNSQTLVKIKEAKTQVVAGTNFYLTLQLVESNCRKGSEANSVCKGLADKPLQECEVVVYDRPWDKHREMTSAKCKTLEVSDAARNRRDILVGGQSPADVNDDRVKEMAQFAVAQLSARSNSLNSQTLVKIKQAKTQVVAGANYYLTLQLVESNCRKGSEANSVCKGLTDKPLQECEVVVYNRPWDKHREMTSAKCKTLEVSGAARNRREIPVGGKFPKEKHSDDVRDMAEFAVEDLNKKSNSMFRKSLVEIISAETQVVSGINYHLKLRIGESNCRKNSVNAANCSPNDLSHPQECEMTVWSQPWKNTRSVTKSNCQDSQDNKSLSAPKGTKDIHVAMFEEFKRKYNRVYSSEEEHHKRFRIFRANMKKIKVLQDSEQGTAVYGPNMFADLSEKEFKRHYLGLKPGPVPQSSNHHMRLAQIPNVELPVEFDWRDRGAVTPVKNQGQCGSCWAFSVTGNVEGQWFLKHGKLLSLSEQELVDCDKRDDGCMGGFMTQAYESIEELGGLETEDEYPYEAENESCKFNKSEARATVTSSVNITTNETQIAQWLFKNGPISIGINANAMQFYMGGVSHPFKFLCNKEQLDHGVLLVGFGVHNYPMFHKSLPFWVVKNSWGPRWGEQGYYRVYRGDGTCGVNQMCSSAVVG